MDNLTHTLIGVSIANAGLRQRVGRGTTWALAIASNIPDIDVFFGLFLSGDSFLYRRMWTHSVVGLPVLSLIFGYVFHKIFRNLSFKTTFGLFLLGTSLHVLFDLMNSYGVVLLHPFTLRRFELGWLFIIDLAIWAMLLLPHLLAIVPRWRTHLQRWSRAAVIGLTAYTFFCGAVRWRASTMVSAFVGKDPELFRCIFPEALGPHRFREVVRFADVYHTFVLHPLTGRVDSTGLVFTQENSPEVGQILQHQKAKELMWFFKAPVWEKGKEENQWDVYDLRFQSAVFGDRRPFTYRFRLANGQVTPLD